MKVNRLFVFILCLMLLAGCSSRASESGDSTVTSEVSESSTDSTESVRVEESAYYTAEEKAELEEERAAEAEHDRWLSETHAFFEGYYVCPENPEYYVQIYKKSAGDTCIIYISNYDTDDFISSNIKLSDNEVKFIEGAPSGCANRIRKFSYCGDQTELYFEYTGRRYLRVSEITDEATREASDEAFQMLQGNYFCTTNPDLYTCFSIDENGIQQFEMVREDATRTKLETVGGQVHYITMRDMTDESGMERKRVQVAYQSEDGEVQFVMLYYDKNTKSLLDIVMGEDSYYKYIYQHESVTATSKSSKEEKVEPNHSLMPYIQITRDPFPIEQQILAETPGYRITLVNGGYSEQIPKEIGNYPEGCYVFNILFENKTYDHTIYFLRGESTKVNDCETSSYSSGLCSLPIFHERALDDGTRLTCDGVITDPGETVCAYIFIEPEWMMENGLTNIEEINFPLWIDEETYYSYMYLGTELVFYPSELSKTQINTEDFTGEPYAFEFTNCEAGDEYFGKHYMFALQIQNNSDHNLDFVLRDIQFDDQELKDLQYLFHTYSFQAIPGTTVFYDSITVHPTESDPARQEHSINGVVDVIDADTHEIIDTIEVSYQVN